MFNDLNINRFNTLLTVKSSLISLYLALTFPLIFITLDGFKLISILCLVFGLYFTFSIVSDYVITTENRILLKTSLLSGFFGKKSWEIRWEDITAVKSFPTSQGSNVHYFVTSSQESFLVPQRIERYSEFKEILSRKIKSLDGDLSYISPLWTYKILTLISIIMFLVEVYAFVLRK